MQYITVFALLLSTALATPVGPLAPRQSSTNPTGINGLGVCVETETCQVGIAEVTEYQACAVCDMVAYHKFASSLAR